MSGAMNSCAGAKILHLHKWPPVRLESTPPGNGAYLSRMSEMMQAYMSRPSGNWSATRRAFACFILHTVLWICSDPGGLQAATHKQLMIEEMVSSLANA